VPQTRLTRRVAGIAGVIAVGAAALVAATASGGTASRAADIAGAKALLAKYSKQPKFVPPGPAFDAKSAMAGKKIMSIPISSQIPITQVLEASEAAQAKRLGFTFTHWQNQGKSDQWVQGFNTAIAQKYDAIELIAIDPGIVKPQIEKARKAGIPVIESHLAGFGWKVPSNIAGSVRLPYYDVGRILAAWSIVQTKGEANALAIVAKDLASTADVIKGMQTEYKAHCPSCKLQIANVPTVQWATGVQNEVQSGIQRNPSLNYLIPIYDAMTQFALAGVRAAGKAGKIQMDTFNGTPFALDLVRKGDVQMNLGENEDWIARAMLDAGMRAATGRKVPADDYKAAPLYIFTKANVAKAGSPPSPSKGYGNAYETGFDKLWGLK